MSRHLAWILPILMAVITGLLWLDMSIVTIRKDVDFLELRVEKIIEHCCDLDHADFEYVRKE